jgi:hypothetical protein
MTQLQDFQLQHPCYDSLQLPTGGTKDNASATA